MARWGVVVKVGVLALAAREVAAQPTRPDAPSPVELTAEVHVRSVSNFLADDAALDGKGPGASVRLGRDWLHLQISWDYVRETVGDPFEDVSYDERANVFLIGPSFVGHVGSRVSLSAGAGLAVSRYNGRDAPRFELGGWTDIRLDIDLVEVAPGHRIALVASGSLVLVNPAGAAGTIGLGYHLR